MTAKAWKSILVAVRDPGARKQVALTKAAAIASRTSARLTLFHAFSSPVPLPSPVPSNPRAILSKVAAYHRGRLQELAKPLRRRGIKVTCEAVWDFPPAHAIVRRVLQSPPDLVIAESHRHMQLARWFLANSDWELIRECPCPVWFVKREQLPGKSLVLAAVDPSHAHAKPAALDDRLLRAASAVTDQLGGRVAMLHVRDAAWSAPQLRSSGTPIAAASAESIARLAARHQVDMDLCLMRKGVPARHIVSTVSEFDVDLLVMGAVSRGSAGHAPIGNTAEAVLDEVGCDVLVVKPRNFRTSVTRKRPSLGPLTASRSRSAP